MKLTEKQLLEYIIRNEVKKVMEASELELNEGTLSKAFIQPFTDIYKTARAGVEKTAQTVASTVGSLVKQSFMSLMPYIPGITDANAMKKVDQKHKQNLKAKLDRIDSRYSEVIQRNWDALAESDAGTLLFLVNPQLALGAGLFKKGAEVSSEQAANALDMVDGLIGGKSEILRSAIGKLRKVAAPLSKGGSRGGTDMSDYGSTSDFGDTSYFEEQALPTQARNQQQTQQPQQPKQDYRQYVEDILKNPEVQAALKNMNNPAVAAMQQTAVDAIVDNARELLNFSFEDVKKKAGPEYNKIIEQFKKNPEFQNKNIDTDKQLQDQIVAEMKKAAKQPAIDQLNVLVQQNSTLEPAVKKAIAEIQKL